jgi:hypothetical protein
LDTTPSFTVTGNVSDTAEFIYHTGGATSTLATFTLDSATTTVTLPEFTTDNTYYISTRLVDINNNASAYSSVLSLTVDTTAPTNQNTVLATNFYTKESGVVSATVVSSGDVSNTLWVAPSGTTTFSQTATATQNC